MHLSALFLDVGHTLVREEPSRFAIYAQVAREHGCTVDEERMRVLMRQAHAALPSEIEGSFRYSDPWFRAFIEHIFGQALGLDGGHVGQIAEELFARFEAAATFRVYPGAIELLDEARDAGLTLGVISNWSARLPRLLEAIGLAQRFDFVLCSALEGAEKPQRVLFERALDRAGVRAEAAAHAGDRLDNDVEAARAVGLHAVLVDHDGTVDPSEATRAGIPRVRDLIELKQWILERCA